MTGSDEYSSNVILGLAEQLGVACQAAGLQVCCAESCTGGLIAGAITEVAGSSAWFGSGVVTYSNAAKQQLLGVDTAVFELHGAVSEACVLAMAKGAIAGLGADVAVSVSGVAGPGGATAGKPVGTVWIAWAFRENNVSSVSSVVHPEDEVIRADARHFQFDGSRSRVRTQTVEQALRGILSRIENAGLHKP